MWTALRARHLVAQVDYDYWQRNGGIHLDALDTSKWTTGNEVVSWYDSGLRMTDQDVQRVTRRLEDLFAFAFSPGVISSAGTADWEAYAIDDLAKDADWVGLRILARHGTGFARHRTMRSKNVQRAFVPNELLKSTVIVSVN